MSTEAGQVTLLLSKLSAGDRSVEEKLVELVYAELKRIAAIALSGEAPGNSLQRTALVHEAWVKLVESGTKMSWKDRGHFFAMAATQMRHILIDRARHANAQKRSGKLSRIPLDAIVLSAQGHSDFILAIDEALCRLEALDPRQAKVVEMRVYGGLTPVEIAETLGISDRTVKRDWVAARAWLHRELNGLS